MEFASLSQSLMIFVMQKLCMSQESVRIMTETSNLDTFWTFHGCAPYPGQWLPYPDQWWAYPDHWLPYPDHWPPYPGQGFLGFFNDLYFHHFWFFFGVFPPSMRSHSYLLITRDSRCPLMVELYNHPLEHLDGQQRHSHVHQIWCRAGSAWFPLLTDVQQLTIYPESLRWHFTWHDFFFCTCPTPPVQK